MDVSAPTWEAVRHTLTAALGGLPERSFVVIGEPVQERPRAGGLLGLLGGRAAPEPARFVQALRDGDALTVECVGASSFGGPWDVDAATDARLRALGWLAPGDAGYEPTGGPNYRRWACVADHAAVAGLLVASLEALGLAATGPLEMTTDR